MKKWRLLTVTSDEYYLVDGVNVFDAEVSDRRCVVRDPWYNKREWADVFYLQGKTAKHKIVILELRPLVYAIYIYK